MVAVGQTLVILGGSLDLSVAYQVSVTAVMASYVMQGDPDRMLLGVGVVIAIGIAIGLANGLIITGLGVNPFIATLGMALILRGVLNSSFDNFAGAVPAEFQVLGYGSIGPIPYSVLLFLAVVVIAWFLLRYTRFGHHLYAVGGSEETARLSGVRSARVLIGAHVLCSLTCVLTGLFIVSRLRAGAPWVGPDGNYDLESIAAVVARRHRAQPAARAACWGRSPGVLILALLDNLFNQLEVNTFLKDVLRGVIIVAAVAAYAAARPSGAAHDRRTATDGALRTGADASRGGSGSGAACAGRRRSSSSSLGAARLDRHPQPELHRSSGLPRLSQARGAADDPGRGADVRHRLRRVRPVGRLADHRRRRRRGRADRGRSRSHLVGRRRCSSGSASSSG